MYVPTAREIQREEALSRSPIYANFSETVSGVATIRAYGAGGECPCRCRLCSSAWALTGLCISISFYPWLANPPVG